MTCAPLQNSRGVEQRPAHLVHTQKVAGSNPAPATNSGVAVASGAGQETGPSRIPAPHQPPGGSVSISCFTGAHHEPDRAGAEAGASGDTGAPVFGHIEIHESPSNRDASTGDEASSTAAPQGEAVHAGIGSETPAGREGHAAKGAEYADDAAAVDRHGGSAPPSSFPTPLLQTGDGGRPSTPSADAEPEGSGAAATQGHFNGQSAQERRIAPHVRNEPGSGAARSAINIEFPERVRMAPSLPVARVPAESNRGWRPGQGAEKSGHPVDRDDAPLPSAFELPCDVEPELTHRRVS